MQIVLGHCVIKICSNGGTYIIGKRIDEDNLNIAQVFYANILKSSPKPLTKFIDIAHK